MEKLLDIIIKLLTFYKKKSISEEIEKDKHIAFLQEKIEENKSTCYEDYYKRRQFKFKTDIDTSSYFAAKIVKLLDVLGPKFSMEHLKNVFFALRDDSNKQEAVVAYSYVSQFCLKWYLRFMLFLFFVGIIGWFVIINFYEEFLLLSVSLYITALLTAVLVFVVNYSDYRIYLIKRELEQKGRNDLLKKY